MTEQDIKDDKALIELRIAKLESKLNDLKVYNVPGRHRNVLCPCESGKKVKSCCGTVSKQANYRRLAEQLRTLNWMLKFLTEPPFKESSFRNLRYQHAMRLLRADVSTTSTQPESV